MTTPHGAASLCRPAFCSLMALASATHAGPSPCTLVENGSFDTGTRGWIITPLEQMEGDATASATSSLFDGSTYETFTGKTFDSSVLRFDVLAQVNSGPDSAAVAEVTASTTAVVTDTGLRVMVGGFWEFLYFGQILHTLDVSVDVEGPDGETASAGSHAGSTEPRPGCLFGLSVIGTFDMSPPTIEVDLAGNGIEIGDEVEISITLRAETGTVDACQSGDVSAFLLIDNIGFCPAAVFADLNGDGLVNAADLALLLGAWTSPDDKGACGGAKSCPPDLNDDGFVNAADLALLLGAWS